ncbi:MAG: phytoene/squalene synthase family protein [Deltaproteobacteria bacterium]|nr:phytoene/squalene synthase family protein [Deltaproteobacteria bacterium]NND30445.1 phytoene/squalene synthase family protein [Myxococcales bacterium]MBT8465016.1 phytoene/squalene synthase family protein [Deltaproteobacteria bacterium]MBT8480739.1 phytoene/squalene synthase family protein [Deltaproteobacteria bacterium]NNK44891.1 phytoene/squalene synthase family protein [Myxococcales bacterium]
MSAAEAKAREAAHWSVLAMRARSFRWASAFLSATQRRRVADLYAFCRAVDDLADAQGVTPEAQQDLERLQTALASEPDGRSLWPREYLWFRELCVDCNIDFKVVQELIDGMISDLSVVRMPSDTELIRYCYQAAGTVGLMMCSILGVRDPRALGHAVDLGIAMQLTNISRDVLEDAQSSRVYLPADRLRAVGVEPEQLIEGSANPRGVSLVVDDLLTLAEVYYRSADEGMSFLPARARWAVLVASRLYRGIGRRLRRKRRSNPLLGRVVLPWFVKLALFVPASASWFRLSLRRSTRPALRSPSASSESALGG